MSQSRQSESAYFQIAPVNVVSAQQKPTIFELKSKFYDLASSDQSIFKLAQQHNFDIPSLSASTTQDFQKLILSQADNLTDTEIEKKIYSHLRFSAQSIENEDRVDNESLRSKNSDDLDEEIVNSVVIQKCKHENGVYATAVKCSKCGKIFIRGE